MEGLSKLGDVYLTVVEEETYNYSNSITEKAMEDGSKATDHATSNLITIHISGVMIGKGKYPQEDLTKLRMYCLNRNVLRYEGIQNFSSVMIESFGNKHGVEIANGITFDITLKEIRKVKKQNIAVNTGKLNIPDIEELKEQIKDKEQNKKDTKNEAKKQQKVAAKTKLKKITNKGRQAKQPKQKKSILQKIRETNAS